MPDRLLLTALVVVASLAAAACSDDASTAASSSSTSSTSSSTSSSSTSSSSTTTQPALPDALPVPDAELTEITMEGSPWAQVNGFDLADVGYTQTEYKLRGTARSFTSDNELGEDGRWTAIPDDTADFHTRVLVHRPADPAAFNGTVVVEWFNVSGGLDANPDWTTIHTELIREGYAWVGVSAQFVGVEGQEGGGIDLGFRLDLKGFNPDRYGDLSHPGDSWSYDIYTQAAQAVVEPGGVDPLEGLEVERTIAIGESQSASRLTTYVNAIDPLTRVFDGFLIHSRGDGSSGIADGDDAPAMPERVTIREDVRVPVLTFETETDIFRLGFLSARQPDTEMIRLWEGAGTSHSDAYVVAQDLGGSDVGDDPSIADVVEISNPIPGFIECASPINSGVQHWLMNAAIHALNEWLITGVAPPEAPRFEITDSGDDFVLDDLGNVVGGIRSPWVDAPVATLRGTGQEGENFCGIYGTTALFDEATLAELYPNHDAYVAAIEASLTTAVDAGHIRPADAELIREAAAASDIGS